VPALAARFFDGHLALALGGLLLATLVLNIFIARMRRCRSTGTWACGEAACHHAMASSGPWDAAGNRSSLSNPTSDWMPIRNPHRGGSPATLVSDLRDGH
jgi:hypothetical protein